MLHRDPGQIGLACGTRRSYGRENAAACGMKFLIRGSTSSEGELVHPIAAEAGVRVAVDEPGNRAETAAVDLLGACGKVGRKLVPSAPRSRRVRRDRGRMRSR